MKQVRTRRSIALCCDAVYADAQVRAKKAIDPAEKAYWRNIGKQFLEKEGRNLLAGRTSGQEVLCIR